MLCTQFMYAIYTILQHEMCILRFTCRSGLYTL